MNPVDARGPAVRFGSFVLHPTQRMLLDGEQPVHLGGRALDILCLLVERAGEFVSKEDLVARVWPRTVVVDGNLRVHIAGLRKALGEGRQGQRYIVNSPNRGYSFAAPVQRGVDEAGDAIAVAPAAPPPAVATPRSLPAPLHRVVGRARAVESVTEQVLLRRMVTLVGAGGIGKTTLAVTVAAALKDRPVAAPWQGIHFIDLASLAEARLVASALASTLGLASVVEDALPSLIAFLHDKALLLIFDNCEHLVAAVAELSEAVLRGAPKVHILATSREPLRAEGEWVQRLQPLAIPQDAAGISAEQALAYSAVELFVERAVACSDSFTLVDDDVAPLIDICHRLDGIPLALEFAAARVDPLGLRGLAAALDDRFSVLNKGRRTAMPRQQTLRATLDWSFDLLPERDRTVLLRLSAFAGAFTLESATSVAGWGGLLPLEIVDSLSDLVAKSMVTADVSRDETFFRLLDTTRAYARDKLAMSDDGATVARRHAMHCTELLRQAEAEWPTSRVAEWFHTFGRRIDDLRAALLWAFSADGDVAMGVELTTKAAPLLFQLSLADELRQHAERALQAIGRPAAVSPQLEFALNIVFGHALYNTRGLHPDSKVAFHRALQIATETDDAGMLAVAYSTNWMGAYNRGETANMMAFARLFEAQTSTVADPAMALMHDRMKVPTLHFMGDQSGARQGAERSLQQPIIRPPFLSGSQIDRRVSMGTILGRVLWVQGHFAAAEEMAQRTVDTAMREGESIALAFALAFCACPVAMWNGQLALARERTALLARHTREHSLRHWQLYADFYGPLLSAREDTAARRGLLDQFATMTLPPQFGELLATLDPGLAGPTVFARGDDGSAGWCAAELLRLRALHAMATDPGDAEALLLQSLDLSLEQGALSWQVRSANTLARLWIGQAREAEAGALLTRVAAGLGDPSQTPDVTELRGLQEYLETHRKGTPHLAG